MERLQFKNKVFTVDAPAPSLIVRSNREQLIADIVNVTNEKNKKHLARLIALAANSQGWSEADLHALLAKRNDPKIRNFTAFVKWSIKTNAVQLTTPPACRTSLHQPEASLITFKP